MNTLTETRIAYGSSHWHTSQIQVILNTKSIRDRHITDNNFDLFQYSNNSVKKLKYLRKFPRNIWCKNNNVRMETVSVAFCVEYT